MKLPPITLTASLLMVALPAPASLWLDQSFSGGTISGNACSTGLNAGGNPVGTVFPVNFTEAGAGDIVQDMTVTLNISGGLNADLYAALVAPNGACVVLMNQPGHTADPSGFGATGAGMNIILSDAGTQTIQGEYSANVLSGTYQPDQNLSGLAGSQANGTWNLYFATVDSTAGVAPAVLDGFSLDIEAVPEPITPALEIFGSALVLLTAGRLGWRRFKSQYPRIL